MSAAAAVAPGRGPVVFVTRPEPEAAALAARLRGEGVAALSTPALRRVRRERASLADLDPAGAPPRLVLTSPAAARALGEDLPAPALAPLTAFCVGDETARAARAVGLGRAISADGDASALLALLRRDGGGGALLHYRGADVARPLGPPLQAAGFALRERVLYAAEPVRALPEAAAALAEGAATALFLSARAAQAFAEAVGPAAAGRCAALCLSPRIAQSARAAGFAPVAAATRPRLDALIALLLELNSPEGPGRESNR